MAEAILVLCFSGRQLRSVFVGASCLAMLAAGEFSLSIPKRALVIFRVRQDIAAA